MNQWLLRKANIMKKKGFEITSLQQDFRNHLKRLKKRIQL